MRKLITIAVVSTIIFSPAVSFAVAQQDTSPQNNGTNDSSQSSQNSSGNATQTQTQTQNANMGEETQQKISQEIQTKLNEVKSTYSATNSAAKQSLVNIGSAAEKLIKLSATIQDDNASLATKIQTIAKAQVEATDKISQNIDNAQSKSSLVKFFTGADYKQLKEANQQMEQNRLRIKELNQIKAQIKNSADATELQNQINVLEAQSTTLQDQINSTDGSFSLLGWLFKWING